MKRHLLLFLFAAAGALSGRAQTTPTFSQHVAAIIFTHCTSCHRSGEIAPFALTNYSEVSAWGPMIRYVTNIRYMPPWKPDQTYQHYQKENLLSDGEIETIRKWVDGGMPQGDPQLTPPPPVFPSGSQIGQPDLVLHFAQSYKHVGNNKDEYRYFVIPTGLTQNKDLVSLEVRPGNKSIVHHTLVWQDTTGQAAADDAATPEYGYAVGNANATALDGQLPSYVPGIKPQLFTNGIAYRLKAGSDLKLQMHYAPKPTDEWDSTTINLFFAQQPASRYLQSFVMVPVAPYIQNGPFIIAPNQVKKFYGKITLPQDVSMVGIAPHMHKLGQDWLVYAIKPGGDTVKLIRINDWDFNWQGAFYFRSLIHLPAGTSIHAYATYDNTTSNVNNPNNPPKMVTWGENTSDEMFYLPLLYLAYKPGDENIVFENPTAAANSYYSVSNKLYPVAPNPAGGKISIGFTLSEGSRLGLRLYNMSGQAVRTFIPNSYFLPGLHSETYDVSDLPTGTYTIRLEGENIRQEQKLTVQH